MQTSTKLRLFGAAVMLFNLWVVGRYDVQGVPVLLMTLGFALAFEVFVVRLKNEPPTTVEKESDTSVSGDAVDGPSDLLIAKHADLDPRQEMTALGITFDGQKYRYQSYAYEKFEDALAYARMDQDRKFRWK